MAEDARLGVSVVAFDDHRTGLKAGLVEMNGVEVSVVVLGL